MKLIKNVIPSDYSELSSLAKRGILVFACGGKTAVAGKNQDPHEFTNQVQHRTKVLRWKKESMSS
jgi:hypothetical protein